MYSSFYSVVSFNHIPMKFTFSDSHDIDELNFRRLMLMSNELTFVERPSIQLIDNFGTIAQDSRIRRLLPKFENSQVKLNVEQPPTTMGNSYIYQEYFKTDLNNPQFINTVFEGVKNRWFGSNYFVAGNIKATNEFKDFRSWFLANEKEIKITDLNSIDFKNFGINEIKSKDDAMCAVAMTLYEKSIRVTSVTNISDKLSSNPLSINPYLDQLIKHRLSSKIYTGRKYNAKSLGVKLIQSIIPDEALIKISLDDLLEFRQDTSKYFDAWNVVINQLESKLLIDGFILSDNDILQIIDTDINPQLFELKNEIRSVRDKRFSNVMKIVKNNAIATIIGGSLTGISIPAAILSFIALNLKTPKLTDELIDSHNKLSDIKKSNGLTYLLEVDNLIKKGSS